MQSLGDQERNALQEGPKMEKMKLQLQPTGAAHFQLFHSTPMQTILWRTGSRNSAGVLKKTIYDGERRHSVGTL
jgi:hypothetical protein